MQHSIRPENKALIVVVRDRTDSGAGNSQLAELRQLAVSAGIVPVHSVEQDCSRYDPALCITRGKAAQIRELARQYDAGLVIFSHDLTAAQQRNLEEEIGAAVADRTGLILDIFAQRARSREGRLQVELAQLNYLLPRLKGAGQRLSRLGGGIGTRGPGETKLETDRRKIRRRMQRLRESLQHVALTRHVQRAARERHGRHTAALVGYTNAGKSSLLNLLSGSSVAAENRLFSTLDPTTRRVSLSGGGAVLLSDTVGFIQQMPPQLMAAFKATLEELLDAALLVHVVDAADGMAEEHIAAVHAVLDELGAGCRDMVYVFNKIDLLQDRAIIRYWERTYTPAIAVSAKTGEGMEHLRAYLRKWTDRALPRVCLRIPRAAHRALDAVMRQGTILSRMDDGDAVIVTARLDAHLAHGLRRFWVPEGGAARVT